MKYELMDNDSEPLVEVVKKGDELSEPKWLCAVDDFGGWKDGENIITWVDYKGRSVQRIEAHCGVVFVYTTEEPSDGLCGEMDAILERCRYHWVARVGPSGVMTVGVPKHRLVNTVEIAKAALMSQQRVEPKFVVLTDYSREAIVESLDITLRQLNLGTLGDIEPGVFKVRYNTFKIT